MKESKSFSDYKKKQYLNLYNQFESTLENIASSDYLSNIIDTHLINIIKSLTDGEISNINSLPKSYLLNKIGKLNNKIYTTLSNRFYISIKKLWGNSYDLGKQHTILDMLYTIKPYRKYLDSLNPIKSITNLLNNISFSNAILNLQNKDEIAEFADNVSESRILRAKKTEIVLRNNYNKLEDEGFFDDIFNDSDIVAYLSVADRVTFYETINRIYDYKQKAKATDNNFLANNYMKNRYRVLARDYAKKYDDKVKDLIYDYLNKDIENVRQLKGTINRAEKLNQDIFKTLNKANISKKQDPITKQKLIDVNFKASKTIVRTELNLAYNFGKLSGFTSPYDLNRKFKWNASWELEYKNPYYEVCKYCESMDGREFTVADLLFVGTQLDYGIMKYKGTPKTKTSFKNPLLPMISAHPNCSCFYSLVEEDPEEYEKRSETIAPINIDELRNKRLNNYDIEKLYRQKPSNGLLESSLALAGAGLLVGGIFLLSRSNVFKSFYQVSRDYFKSNPSLAKTIINETLENSPTEIINKTKDVYKTVKNIDPELGNITQDIIKNSPDLRVDMTKIDLDNITLPDTTL